MTELNKCRDLLDTVGKGTLERIAKGYLDLLETSAAIYEVDGSYAIALFSSGYCKLMDRASRELCGTSDNAEALACGKWLCHRSCWSNASKITIETGAPYDLKPCEGGINIYAVPIKAFGKVIGSINCGYGSPPSDDMTLCELANKYHINKETLTEISSEYEARPEYIVRAAKNHILLAADLIGQIYERSVLERNALEKEEQFHTAFKFSTIGTAITSPTKGWIEVNNEVCRMLGYSKDELSVMTWAEITHPGDLESDVTQFNRVLAGEMDGYSLDKRFIRKDGSVIYTTLWVNCKRRDDGAIDYCVALLQDITARKKIEQEREQFHKFFNSSDDLMVIADPNGAFKSINPACTKVLGYSESELLSKPFIDFVHPDDQQSTLDEMARQIQRGYSLDFENRYICKNGSFRYLSWHASYIAKEGITYATARDITDFKILEADLIKTNTERIRLEEQSKTILANTIEGFWILDKEGNLIQANEAYCNMTGYTQQELLQKGVADIEVIETPEEIEKRIMKIMETGVDRFESKHRCKNGGIIDVEVSVNFIKSDNVMFSFIRDITQRKQIEDEIKTINVNLQKRVDEEVAKNRDKDQLMFEQSKYISMSELLINISHHWRQPLCAIGVSIQDIKDAYIHGELDEAYITKNVNNSMSELLKLSDTIDNFRNFYTQERTLKEINVADEINKAESLISGYIINKGIIINKELDESLTVQGYQNEFTNVILNVLTNAKDKFEERNITGGIIKVQSYKDAATGKVIVSVSDNGGEISKDIITKVFEPYFTTKDKAQRTGMGLYMSKVIIEKNMKGTLSVRNRDGWCEFRIEI
ncbi:MAG: PAS domain S-box protein [Nitrospirae bacterium]|nr:PAS domain S-box protein [Nitrospirota bacterium]MBF0536282.1 PAS domain S-box protein [Nitrospirota bacterium]MBF0618228.1 PAS domain S-box protein [Nitrospirota bacterium]